MSRAACAVMAELLGEDEVRHTDVWSCGCTDMGDVGCLMPVLPPHIGGAAGRAHGEDFRITDPECACVQSAAGQLALLARLPSLNARAIAKAVAANTRASIAPVPSLYMVASSDPLIVSSITAKTIIITP